MNAIEVRIEDIGEGPHLGALSYGRDYSWLIESIERVGLITPPLLARRGDGELSLLCGKARVEALRRLGATRTTALVRPHPGQQKSFELAVADNLHGRGFNEVEKAGGVNFILNFLRPSRREAERILGLFPIALNPRAVSRYLKLHAADDGVKRRVVEGCISLNTFVLMSGLGREARDALLEVIDELKPGFNYQQELVFLCEDISTAEACTIPALLARDEIAALVRNGDLSVPLRIKRLFQRLRGMRSRTGARTGDGNSAADGRSPLEENREDEAPE
jgi:hypothetical protein